MAGSVKTPSKSMVGMGQIDFAHPSEPVRAVLGSCVGLVLYHPPSSRGMLAHIVLPEAAGRQGPPGKFADTALPYMLEELQKVGAYKSCLIAKIAGGGQMFGGQGPLQIGKQNVAAVEGLLQAQRITLVGSHVGGQQGRRVQFDATTGEYHVEVAGKEKVIL